MAGIKAKPEKCSKDRTGKLGSLIPGVQEIAFHGILTKIF